MKGRLGGGRAAAMGGAAAGGPRCSRAARGAGARAARLLLWSGLTPDCGIPAPPSTYAVRQSGPGGVCAGGEVPGAPGAPPSLPPSARAQGGPRWQSLAAMRAPRRCYEPRAAWLRRCDGNLARAGRSRVLGGSGGGGRSEKWDQAGAGAGEGAGGEARHRGRRSCTCLAPLRVLSWQPCANAPRPRPRAAARPLAPSPSPRGCAPLAAKGQRAFTPFKVQLASSRAPAAAHRTARRAASSYSPRPARARRRQPARGNQCNARSAARVTAPRRAAGR